MKKINLYNHTQIVSNIVMSYAKGTSCLRHCEVLHIPLLPQAFHLVLPSYLVCEYITKFQCGAFALVRRLKQSGLRAEYRMPDRAVNGHASHDLLPASAAAAQSSTMTGFMVNGDGVASSTNGSHIRQCQTTQE